MQCTRDFEKHYVSIDLISKLKFAQHMCSKCEAVKELSVDSKQRGKRT